MPRTHNEAFNKALGANIRYARIAAKISQTDLGSRVGVSFQQMQKYEKGKDTVSAPVLVGISNAVGKSVSELLDIENGVTPASVPSMRETAKVAGLLDRIAQPEVRRRVVALIDALGETAEAPVPLQQAAE